MAVGTTQVTIIKHLRNFKSSLMDIINELKKNDYYIAEINGAECKDAESFLSKIGVAFKFPDYYGKNLDAFWECIGDLSWIDETNYALVIYNKDSFLLQEPDKIKVEIIELLEKIRIDWGNVPNYKGEDEFRKKADFQIIITETPSDYTAT
jgi:RNAse (barnase) inhibitor barstar